MMATLRRNVAGLVVMAGCTVVACHDEDRVFREMPPAGSATNVVRLSDLQPGGAVIAESTTISYATNAFALQQGKKLFDGMNCSGCHFHGGGGIGPALMDSEWTYGSDPSQIFNTIVEGRPNGMPSFKGRLTNPQVWQLVAYVRSLSALDGTTSSSAREDHMYLSPDLQLRHAERPRNGSASP